MKNLLVFSFLICLFSSSAFCQESGSVINKKICVGHAQDHNFQGASEGCINYNDGIPIQSDPRYGNQHVTLFFPGTNFTLSYTQGTQVNVPSSNIIGPDPCRSSSEGGQTTVSLVVCIAQEDNNLDQVEIDGHYYNQNQQLELLSNQEVPGQDNCFTININICCSGGRIGKNQGNISSNTLSFGEDPSLAERGAKTLINNQQQSSSMNIYPNPSIDRLFLNENFKKIQIISTNNQVVLSKSTFSNDIKELDISNLKSGLYYIIMENNGHRKIDSFVKL